VDTADESARARRTPSGARSGALIAAASFVATGLNYVFLLAAGRLLGSDDYGALAALLGLLTVVLLPTSALQLAVSREVSRRRAIGDLEGADAFGRAALRLSLIATAPIVAFSFVLVLPLRELLNIQSTAAVTLAMAGLAAALVLPVALGVLQGYERFHAIAALYVLPFALRLALLAAVALAGFQLGGAVFAAVVGGLAAALVAVALLREPLRRGARAARPALGPFFRYLWPVVVGLIGIAVLTNFDLLVVKARFAGDEAGEYAVASAFARVAFFLPATILAVLFPRTAARHARGEETEDILGRSLIVTAVFGGALALFYAMTGRGLVHTSFGAEFAEGGELLVPFTLSMVLFALANVLVGFHLSRGETRYAWIVAGAVPVQIAVLAMVPGSLRGVIWADVVVGTALLCAHELFVDSSVPALGAGLRHFSAAAAGMRLRRVAGEGLAVLLVGIAFVSLLFWPLVVALGSTVVGDGSDASGQIADFWWMTKEGGYHLFGTTHHTLTGAPFGWDEGNGLNIQLLLPYYPAYLAAHIVGPVAAYNLVLISGYVFSGAAMYVLARYLGCVRLVATWAGLVYVVFPWHLARTPHASLVHLEFLPLLILTLVAAAQRPSWSRFSLVGLAALACWLTSGYFGVMAFVAATAFALAVALGSPLRRGGVLVAGSVGAALAASFVVALLSVIAGFGRGAGLKRVAGDLEVFGVRPLELVAPAPGNFVLGDWVEELFDTRQHGSNPTETRNYLGLLTMALALSWIVIAWRRRATLAPRLRFATAGLAGIFVAAILVAAPSPITVFGHGIPMPSRLVWEVIPAVRVPSRFVALAMTALIPLAALGLQAAWRRLARPAGEYRAAAYVVVVAAMVVSFLELTVSPSRPRFRTTPAPPEYVALEDIPSGIVAEYPLVTTNDHIIWQTVYRRPLLNNADFGTPADNARRVVLNPAVAGAAETLALLGVTAIVTHPDALDYRDFVPDVPNASWGPGYELVTRTPDGSSTWRVTAPPAPALVTLPGGFGEPAPPKDGVVGYPLISPSGVGTIELVAREPVLVSLSFDAAPPGGRQVLRLAGADRELPFTLEGRTGVSVVVEIPRGRSYLLVKTDPAATSEKDAIVFSAPRARRASGTPELHAEPISPDPGF
jgi:O-antigen/teichoic acid export membrane protein